MAIMLIKDALDTDSLGACSTEILYIFIRVAATHDCTDVVQLVVEETELSRCACAA